jgi:hypothetical protein
MEITFTAGGGFPSYPFWKVVVAGDRALVAELPCESPASENLYFHEDLVSRLRETYPELGQDTEFTAGWLKRSGDEATLHLHLTAARLGDDDLERIGRGLCAWCNATGVRKLAVVDPSDRAAGAGNGWELP